MLPLTASCDLHHIRAPQSRVFFKMGWLDNFEGLSSRHVHRSQATRRRPIRSGRLPGRSSRSPPTSANSQRRMARQLRTSRLLFGPRPCPPIGRLAAPSPSPLLIAGPLAGAQNPSPESHSVFVLLRLHIFLSNNSNADRIPLSRGLPPPAVTLQSNVNNVGLYELGCPRP